MVTGLNLSSQITAPVKGAAPVASFTGTEYNASSITWAVTGGAALSGNFSSGISYTATVALAANPGYTFTGVGANTFTYTGATVTNAIDSGTVTIVFPAPTVSSITIVGSPKTVYGIGETFDLAGLTLTVDWSNGDQDTGVAITSGMQDSTWSTTNATPGTGKTYTVTHSPGVTATITVGVVQDRRRAHRRHPAHLSRLRRPVVGL